MSQPASYVGAPFKTYDTAPEFFCSVGCAADAGPVNGGVVHRDPPARGRAAQSRRSPKVFL